MLGVSCSGLFDKPESELSSETYLLLPTHSFFLGVILVGVVHLTYSDNLGLWDFIALMFFVFLLILLFIASKCRYVIEGPKDSKVFIYGDIFREERIPRDRIMIKRVWPRVGLYKLYVGPITFYILSNDQAISDYINMS
jgi:hypothetical protein